MVTNLQLTRLIGDSDFGHGQYRSENRNAKVNHTHIRALISIKKNLRKTDSFHCYINCILFERKNFLNPAAKRKLNGSHLHSETSRKKVSVSKTHKNKHGIERFIRENRNNSKGNLFSVYGFNNSLTLIFVYCKQRS